MNSLSIYLKNYWRYKQTGIATKINGFLYFLRKLPLVGKKIPASVYEKYGIKEGLAIVATIFQYGWRFLIKFFWLALYFGLALGAENIFSGFLGSAASTVENSGPFGLSGAMTLYSGLLLWLIFTPVFLGFYEGYSFSAPKGLVDFIGHFSLSRTTVVRGNMIVEVGINAIAYIPAALVYGMFLGKPIETLLFVLLSYLSCNYGFLYVGRIIYTWHLKRKARWVFGTVIGGGILLVGAVLFKLQYAFSFMNMFVSWVGVLGLGAFLYLTAWLFLHFKQENEYLLYWSEQATLTLAKVKEIKTTQNSYVNDGIAMQKKLVITQDDQFDHLRGSQYLNALLFSRYRLILKKALLLRFYGVGAAWVVVIILSFFKLFAEVTSEDMTVTLPILFFLMYWMSFGKKVVQMVFVNCDVSMLYYPFYREAGTIISGFNYRFKQTLKYNSILSAAIFSVYLLLSVLNGFFLGWDFLAVLLLLLVAMTALFSFHELFVYYLLQPFTGDMTVVNPLYKVVSGVFYGIAYMNMQLRLTGFYYAVGLSVVCLIYVIVGFIVIYKKAPQTFRIKA